VKIIRFEKYWRDSKIGAIYEGTSNMQLQTIAKLDHRKMSESHRTIRTNAGHDPGKHEVLFGLAKEYEKAAAIRS
jgi:hypothetical protein